MKAPYLRFDRTEKNARSYCRNSGYTARSLHISQASLISNNHTPTHSPIADRSVTCQRTLLLSSIFQRYLLHAIAYYLFRGPKQAHPSLLLELNSNDHRKRVAMDYLIRFIQMHESFRKSETDALAELASLNLQWVFYSENVCQQCLWEAKGIAVDIKEVYFYAALADQSLPILADVWEGW